MSRPKPNRNNSDLLKYAGLGAQIFVSLGLAVYFGYLADRWLRTPFPLLVWALPLAVLSMMIYKLIRDTSKRKKDEIKP